MQVYTVYIQYTGLAVFAATNYFTALSLLPCNFVFHLLLYSFFIVI